MINKKFIFILCGIIFGIFVTLWTSLIFYEAGSPTGAINIYLKKIQKEQFDKINEIINFSETEFCTKNAYIKFLHDTYNGYDIGSLKFIKEYCEEKNPIKYDIYANGSKISTVSVSPLKNSYVVKTLPEYIDYTVIAPETATVSINGVSLTDKHLINSDIFNFSMLKGTEYPDFSVFSVNGLLPGFDITASIGKINCIPKISSSTVILSLPITYDEENCLKNQLETIAKTYARYVSNDAKFTDLANLLYPNTPYYKQVNSFVNSWYNHTGYDFKNTEISDIIKLSDNAFVGEISFDYILLKGTKEFVFPSSYRIPFVKINDKWLAVCVEII